MPPSHCITVFLCFMGKLLRNSIMRGGQTTRRMLQPSRYTRQFSRSASAVQRKSLDSWTGGPLRRVLQTRNTAIEIPGDAARTECPLDQARRQIEESTKLRSSSRGDRSTLTICRKILRISFRSAITAITFIGLNGSIKHIS